MYDGIGRRMQKTPLALAVLYLLYCYTWW